MDYLIFCNFCFQSPVSNNKVQYFLTNCGNVICQNCAPVQRCPKCGPKCAKKVIASNSDSDVNILFKDIFPKMKKFRFAISYQINRMKQLINHLFSNISKYEKQLEEKNEYLKSLEKEVQLVQSEYEQLKKLHNNHLNQAEKPFMSNIMNSIEDTSFNVFAGENFGFENLNPNPSTRKKPDEKVNNIRKPFPMQTVNPQRAVPREPQKFNSKFVMRQDHVVTNISYRKPPPSLMSRVTSKSYYRKQSNW